MDAELLDKLAVRQLVDDWIIFSDGGDWDRFRAVWHDDGRMMATWTQGTPDEFVANRQKVFGGTATTILHFHGGHSADVAGNRAFAQTKMQIMQRSIVEGVLCDVVCTGRFCDFLEKRDGRWGFVLRQPIYEKDRLDPVDPAGPRPVLDAALLASFPEGYRHLAYLQTRIGYTVKKDMPGLKGPEVEALYARGKAWLAGDPGHPKDW